MYLLETSLRPHYSALVSTPYVNTTGKCLRIFYKFFGDGITHLFIHTEGENKGVQEVMSFSGTQSSKWLGLYTKLPKGLNRVGFKAIRGGTNITGMAIDDLEVADCNFFEGILINSLLWFSNFPLKAHLNLFRF